VFSAISRLPRGCQHLPRSYWIDTTTLTTPQGGLYIRNVRPGLPRDTKRQHVAVKGLRTLDQESAMTFIKVRRTGSSTPRHGLTRRDRLCEEEVVWGYMSCPYILKSNGLFYRNGVPAVVTPFMPHGGTSLNIRADVGRLSLASLDILPAPSIGPPNLPSLYSFWVWPRSQLPPQRSIACGGSKW
jgi:hypothetical protein